MHSKEDMKDQEIRKSDERGIRTPEMQSITGLAILRHTGLGYLVIQVVEDAFPLNAFQIFNLFRGKTVCKNWISTLHIEFYSQVEWFEGTEWFEETIQVV